MEWKWAKKWERESEGWGEGGNIPSHADASGHTNCFSERLQNLLLWWISYSAHWLISGLMSKPLWGPICLREGICLFHQPTALYCMYLLHCSMRFCGCSKIKVECPDAWEGMWGSETPNEWMEQLPNWKGEKKRERVSERMIGAKFFAQNSSVQRLLFGSCPKKVICG